MLDGSFSIDGPLAHRRLPLASAELPDSNDWR